MSQFQKSVIFEIGFEEKSSITLYFITL